MHETRPTSEAYKIPNLPVTCPCIDEETIAGVSEVLRSGWLTSGPKVKEFETKLSAMLGGRPVRVFSSGTAALQIALRIAHIGPGDEVITTPLSWVATSNVILSAGAKPVFVDIDPLTRNIDLSKVPNAITSSTRAIIPVDLAGFPVDRDKLYEIARDYQLRVIEDAAQSLGSSWRGRAIGATGDLVAFSFHPNKNLTSIEGGCLVMNTEEEARLAELLRLHGVIRSGVDDMDVTALGGKYNLSDVAARVGLGQLNKLNEFTIARRNLACEYFKQLDRPQIRDSGLLLPIADHEHTNWHMFQVILQQAAPTRAKVMEQMAARGISTGAHYRPIHLFSLYRSSGWGEGDFPHAELVGRNIITLPLFPTMEVSDVKRVVESLAESIIG